MPLWKLSCCITGKCSAFTTIQSQSHYHIEAFSLEECQQCGSHSHQALHLHYEWKRRLQNASLQSITWRYKACFYMMQAHTRARLSTGISTRTQRDINRHACALRHIRKQARRHTHTHAHKHTRTHASAPLAASSRSPASLLPVTQPHSSHRSPNLMTAISLPRFPPNHFLIGVLITPAHGPGATVVKISPFWHFPFGD